MARRLLLLPQLVGITLLALLAVPNMTTLAFAPCHNGARVAGHKSVSPSASSFLQRQNYASSTRRNVLVLPDFINADVVSSTTIAATDLSSNLASSTSLLSFSDQGQNLAGIFFQASLLPYLTFLYFLSFRGNRTPSLGNFGFQYLLLFVLGTIPSGIVTKSVYGLSLANVDWLHGGAEALLTVTNVLIVLGFREAMINPNYNQSGSKYQNTPQILAGLVAALFAAACALGPRIGFEPHSAFLFGAGNLPQDMVSSLPFGTFRMGIRVWLFDVWCLCFS